jgi:hypothetical protein
MGLSSFVLEPERRRMTRVVTDATDHFSEQRLWCAAALDVPCVVNVIVRADTDGSEYPHRIVGVCVRQLRRRLLHLFRLCLMLG